MSIATRVITLAEVSQWLMPLHPNMTVAILFAGDRLLCCDEAVALELDGQIVGIATISSQGEMYDGTPEIIGMYVLPAMRYHGFGLMLLTDAINRCRERGFTTVRIDLLSERVNCIIAKLPDELRAMLDVRDMSHGLNLP